MLFLFPLPSLLLQMTVTQSQAVAHVLHQALLISTAEN